MRECTVEISKKEGFRNLDGAYVFTGRVITERLSFGSYGDAQQARTEALKDETVVGAAIVADDYRID